MRPPPPPPPLLLYLVAAAVVSVAAVSSHRTCLPPPLSSDELHQPCPPFPSPPSTFPFASSPGCGHPSFQIHCSSPHSHISINSSVFLLLHYRNPNSLTLSPFLPNSNLSSSCPSLPTGPIDFSGSPFRLSPEVCSLLSSSLRHCTTPFNSSSSSSSCPLSSWQRLLLSEPLLLFPACSSPSSPLPRRTLPCYSNVASSLAAFLDSGVRVEWDRDTDPYFANCSSCQKSTGGVCGFNDSASSKPFLCFPSAYHLSRQNHSPTRRIFVLLTTLFAAACILLLLLLSLWASAALRRRWGPLGNQTGCSGGDPMATFLRHHHLHPPIYTYEQLLSSTNGFDPHRKIGDGGFGSVYLAQLDDGRIAAVKRLHRHHPAASTKSFCNEIRTSSASMATAAIPEASSWSTTKSLMEPSPTTSMDPGASTGNPLSLFRFGWTSPFEHVSEPEPMLRSSAC